MEREFMEINGKQVDVTTVFDKSVSYVPTDAEVESVKEKVKRHINAFFRDSLHDCEGIDEMFAPNGIFWRNNGWIVDAMKRSPYYNGNLQLVIRDTPMRRYINDAEIGKFYDWTIKWFLKNRDFINPKTGEVIDLATRDELYKKYEATADAAIGMYRKLRRKGNFVAAQKAREIYVKYEEYTTLILNRRDVFPKERRCFDRIFDYTLQKANEYKEKIEFFSEHAEELEAETAEEYAASATCQYPDEDLVKELNETIEDSRFCTKEMRLSRIVSKLGKKCGINKVVDIREIPFTDADGIPHTRTKDLGWNYRFAQFADAVNPITVNATCVISIHPVDYLRMSFGKNWSSCMTTDKENRRNCENSYHGMYCGGTMSYMLDDSTVVMYYLPEDFKGDEPEWEDKLKRCLFYLGEDKIVQSRVYPDGRDGGDRSLAGDMRNLMHSIVSELWDIPNLWHLEKGTSACSEVVRSDGVQYRDYNCYNDCNVSYMKRIDGHRNFKRITIGVTPICPECGREHYQEDNIFCDRCNEGIHHCADCGSPIYDEDDIYWVDGEPYCRDCVSYCDDCDDYFRTNDLTETANGRYVCRGCLEDDYTYVHGEWYPNDEVIETEEMSTFLLEDEGELWACCEYCGEYHDIACMNRDEETGELYCDDCYERILATRNANN